MLATAILNNLNSHSEIAMEMLLIYMADPPLAPRPEELHRLETNVEEVIRPKKRLILERKLLSLNLNLFILLKNLIIILFLLLLNRSPCIYKIRK